MGVPSFYKWLANKYPKTIVNAVEKVEDDDRSLPNPNGREFDHLYLDMNGIIHPCFHPEYDDVLAQQLNSPVTYDEVFNNIFEYIDRILKIVRPRKLLYMAIDGVAPRAKMNQQRTRRYRTAKDRETLAKEEDRLRRQYELDGLDVLPKEESEASDSNIITPGTEFMYELSKRLQTYIRLRILNNPAWKRLKVILSDANAPGEGEHKIMSFIRLQRTCPGYNPNTSHVLYGLDADLIMLALATHEVHFSILRENVLVDDRKAISNSSEPFLAGNSEANVFDLNRAMNVTTEQMRILEVSAISKRKSVVKKPYQFLHVWILREYLQLDMKSMNLPENFEADVERMIDDFIFICFFAGNDFLPHMPTLEIHEGAIDLLMHVYKEEFKKLGGYLADMQRVEDKKGGYIKFKRVERFILSVGAYEEQIFTKRSEIRQKKLRRMLDDIEHAREDGEDNPFTEMRSTTCKQKGVSGARLPAKGSALGSDEQIVANTKMLKEQVKSDMRNESDLFKNGLPTDTVNLGAPGWKKRYYKYKFFADTEKDMENMRKNVVEEYTKGLCWVLLYYFSDVPSWTWFFPFHYGPFASDMKGLSSTKVVFQRGSPFKPFDQLMAVLPPNSFHALPLLYQSLMTDEDSTISDFYPSKFDIDTDGKRFLWQGICKLPFIEEDRLLTATKKIEKELTEEEAKRNEENVDRLFIHSSDNFALQITSKYEDAKLVKEIRLMEIDTSLSDINGFVDPNLESESMQDPKGITNDHDVLCVLYHPPHYSVHIPRVLEGTAIPEAVVSEDDIEESKLWHDNHGYHSRSYRSYNQIQGPTRNPSVGLRSSDLPGVIIKGAGSSWSAKGRGKTHDFSPNSRTSTCHDAARVSAWRGAYGRGTQRSKTHGFSPNSQTYTSHDAARDSSWHGAYGRGTKGSKTHDFSPNSQTSTSHDAARDSSWCGAYGRGTQESKTHDFSPNSQTSTSRDAARVPSWYGAYGRGTQGSKTHDFSANSQASTSHYAARDSSWRGAYGRGTQGKTGSPSNGSVEWRMKDFTQPNQFWSMRTGSGSSGNKGGKDGGNEANNDRKRFD